MSKVTVAIPCYNSLPFLGDCLRSVVAQTWTDWEAIVVDDCSTDGDPARIIDEFADPRIRLLRHEVNRGLSAARNTAFAAARTPFVVPLDCDDILAPDFLSRLLSILENDPSLDCVFTDFELFGASSGIRTLTVEPLEATAKAQWIPGAGVLMKRELWERAGKYCEAPTLRLGNEDWDFWLAAAAVGFRTTHVPEALYRYRIQAGTLSHQLRALDHLSREFMFRRHRAFIEKFSSYAEFVGPGYWRSAETACARRDRFRALALVCRAFRFAPDPARLRNFLRQLFPPLGNLVDHFKRQPVARVNEQ